MLSHWLYRVLENDEDGDPYDHGLVSATSLSKAVDLVEEHLNALELGDLGIMNPATVRFYPLESRTTSGIHKNSNDGIFEDYEISLQINDEEDLET